MIRDVIRHRTSEVAVLPLAVALREAGADVVGYDVDPLRVAELRVEPGERVFRR